MKSYCLLLSGLLAVAAPVSSEAGCPCNNIQTPALPKPKTAGILLASCTELIVRWKGLPDQAYVVRVVTLDPLSGLRRELPPLQVTGCDADMNCQAVIPASAGQKISWSVQAVRTDGERTYFSYPLRGGTDYPVPACSDMGQSTGGTGVQQKPGAPGGKMRMVVFPNPVSSILNIAFNRSPEEASLRVFDMNGRTVMAQRAGSGTSMQINVSSLSSGNYMAILEAASGKVVYTARFVKE